MQRSTDHILTTHSGSLCRPLPLLKLMKDIEFNNEPRRRSLEEDDLDAVVTEAVKEVVGEQVRIGVDIPGDGEMGRMGFSRYMPHRIGGLEIREREQGEVLPAGPTEFRSIWSGTIRSTAPCICTRRSTLETCQTSTVGLRPGA
jgi:methionine synthase II (cobalamin-independent)